MGIRSGITSRGYHPAIYGMHQSMELREQLRLKRWEDDEKAARNKEAFAAALAVIKELDPAWEAWYDSNRNIPEEFYWLECDGILLEINRRADELIQAAPEQEYQSFDWNQFHTKE